MNLIASSLPGRLRLRAPALRRQAAQQRLVAGLTGLPGALSVAGNAAAGSIALTYDAARVAREDMETAALGVAQAVLGAGVEGEEAEAQAAGKAVATAPAPAVGSRRAGFVAPSLRVRINRQAKRGMLASLAVSLALAAAGARRWHVVSGGAFLVFLALHLTVHRRHLLR